MAEARLYQAPLDQARWQVDKAPGRCRLSQAIPHFGAAVFEARSGAGQRFYLAPERALSAGGRGQLVAAAPFWNPDRPSVELGTVTVSADLRPVLLPDPLAQRMLQQLGAGMVPELRLSLSDSTLRIGMLPVYFRRAYYEYQNCTARLAAAPAPKMAAVPARRNEDRVRFGTNRVELDDVGRAQLERLARRLLEDGSGQVVVEGHSSDGYRRMLNLELSRRRAEAVADYLVERGVDRSRVTTRYFGERYAAPNDRTVRHVDVRLQPAASPSVVR